MPLYWIIKLSIVIVPSLIVSVPLTVVNPGFSKIIAAVSAGKLKRYILYRIQIFGKNLSPASARFLLPHATERTLNGCVIKTGTFDLHGACSVTRRCIDIATLDRLYPKVQWERDPRSPLETNPVAFLIHMQGYGWNKTLERYR